MQQFVVNFVVQCPNDQNTEYTELILSVYPSNHKINLRFFLLPENASRRIFSEHNKNGIVTYRIYITRVIDNYNGYTPQEIRKCTNVGYFSRILGTPGDTLRDFVQKRKRGCCVRRSVKADCRLFCACLCCARALLDCRNQILSDFTAGLLNVCQKCSLVVSKGRITDGLTFIGVTVWEKLNTLLKAIISGKQIDACIRISRYSGFKQVLC